MNWVVEDYQRTIEIFSIVDGSFQIKDTVNMINGEYKDLHEGITL